MKKHARWWALAMIAVFIGVYLVQKQRLLPERESFETYEAPLDLPPADWKDGHRGNPLMTCVKTTDPLTGTGPVTGRPPEHLNLFSGVDNSRLAMNVADRPLPRPAPLDERLQFDILWNGLHVGTIELSTEAAPEDPSLMRAAARVRSNAVVETLYPVDNLFESFFLRSTGATRRFRKDQSEKDHQRVDLIDVDPLVNRALYRKYKRGELRRNVTYDAPRNATDPLGAFYLLRNAKTAEGGSLQLNLLNNRVLSRIKLDRQHDTTVEVPLGTFQCQSWVPDAKQLYEDHPDASATIYLEENTRIPVKIVARMPAPIGRISMILTGWTKGH